MKNILYWLWQLPQNLIGLLYFLHLKIHESYREIKTTSDLELDEKLKDENVKIIYKKTRGGVSLGNYVFVTTVGKTYYNINKQVKHELGHHVQSKALGPVYLIIIGIPSIMWASMRRLGFFKKKSYYSFYTEKSADKIAGIKR